MRLKSDFTKMDLLGDDSGSEVDFTINKDYAKRYEKWRRGEEIQKLKDKYGDVDESESSTSEEEDEDGKELTEDVEKQFFKTLSCLKERNPKIYDQNVRFFDKAKAEQEGEKEGKKSEEVVAKKKDEPILTLAGYQRKVLLETGGQFDDEDAEAPPGDINNMDEDIDIKKSFKAVLNDSDNEGDDAWGSLFTKRVKTAEELEKEEEDYRQWLAGENEKLKNSQMKEELKGLHDYWADPKLDEGEKFLRDYILNRRYLDNDDKNRIPSYDEIVHDSDSNLSADEEMISKQDEFEHKYNFRFEEPDREFIKRYPRTLEQSMRKKDDRRKKHREEVKQRKQAERSKKDEELKRLKTLKKKEIMEKIEKLQQITGNDDIAFQTEDLEGEFDPEKYDRRMSQIFNDDYYGTGEDDEKPRFPDDDELDIENWDDWEGGDGYENYEEELHCEDPGFNMDCDYDPNKKKELQEELIENSKRRKKKRKSKFAECVKRPKPVFDPKDKTFEQYVDEYYSLDYEDLIDDIPCRFKYRKVVPNDFGLSIEEILNASDQELNRWVSIKKITRRQPEHVELYDVKAYKRKASNMQKKAKCFPSLYGPKQDDLAEKLKDVEIDLSFKNHGKKKWEVTDCPPEMEETPATIKDGNFVDGEVSEQKKKKKKKKKQQGLGDEVQAVEPDVPHPEEAASRKKNMKVAVEVMEGGEDGVAKENGMDETEGKKRKKKKKGKGSGRPIGGQEADESLGLTHGGTVSDVPVETGDSVLGCKKKKKKKNKGNADSGEVEVMSTNIATSNSKKRKHGGLDERNVQKSNNIGGNKKRKFHKEDENLCSISDERLRSYGLNPKKYKNKLKYKSK